MNQLNSKQISFLRGLAHDLHPVVMIGNNGLTEQVLKEIDISLKSHELIKIKVFGDDRAARIAMLQEICEKTNAIAVHHIGKQLVIYRQAEQAKIIIPK
ncbi:ribosome assembly RNA-binding protein YhbY [Methylobacillus rhizosphaerae]|uniref:ribosome assembly RNA-binding protein YhbY n=1 Tax=Methylobacillus rhizosphaerae TaxID=551994 RepID=UPI000B76F293|nr:ribosome assembly RNA-binding protein YhbY [Methylobacillus rhizosphaerae]